MFKYWHFFLSFFKVNIIYYDQQEYFLHNIKFSCWLNKNVKSASLDWGKNTPSINTALDLIPKINRNLNNELLI